MQNVLFINDNNLVLRKDDEVIRSKGYAWLKDDTLVFDKPQDQSAEKHCRLFPQQIISRYWQQCDQSSITDNKLGLRHSADLIWKQLSEYQTQGVNELVLVVPSHYQAENLSLLLGVAKASGISIEGLVNKSALALKQQATQAGDYLHVDVQLHQTVMSQVQVSLASVRLGAVEVIQDVGLHVMQEALLKKIQTLFIQNTRFDPLFDAATEQQLFDQLFALGDAFQADGKAAVMVEHESRVHSISLEASDFRESILPFLQRIFNQSRATRENIFLDLNAGFSKSIHSVFNDLGVTIIDSDELPVVPNVHRESETSLDYVTELSAALPDLEGNEDVAQPPIPQQSDGSATHVLLNGTAVAIEYASVDFASGSMSLESRSVGTLFEQLQSKQLYIIGDEGRQTLKPKDRIASALADEVITAILVADKPS